MISNYEATAQQISAIADQIEKLRQQQIEIEMRIFADLGNEYRAGRLTREDLTEEYLGIRNHLTPGYRTRWNNAIPGAKSIFTYASQYDRNRKNGDDGNSWVGAWPLVDGEPYPLKGISVVYVLFNSRNEAIYAGSTGQFKKRLQCHACDGKPFVTWKATHCRDRKHAYELEVQMLRESLPPLNQKAGR